MKNIQQMVNEKILPNITKFTQSRYIQIIMDSFMSVSALIIAGSFFTLVLSLPFGEGYTAFLTSSGLAALLGVPINITTNLISIYLVFAIGYQTAKSFQTDKFTGGVVALGCFLLLTPMAFTASVTDAAGQVVSGLVSGMNLQYFGASGMFMAMIVGILAARLYCFFDLKGIKIKLPASVPSNVSQMFGMMIPGGITLLVFLCIYAGVAATSYGNVYTMILSLIQAPLMNVGGGTFGYIVFSIASVSLWMLGIHGGMVAYVAFSAIIQTNIIENMQAFASGTAAPHPLWMMSAWSAIGGTGATFALVLLMLVRHKSKQTTLLGKLALPCAIFNINEPVIFGCPVIMNPYLAIPFCLIPFVNLAISWFAMSIGLVAFPTGANINPIMPVAVFGALVNSSWTGFALSIVLIAVDFLLWYPFYKAFDDNAAKAERLEEIAA